MDKILNRIKKKNWLIIGFFIFAIPLIIPIVIIIFNSRCDLNISLNEYNKYFEIYSGYFAGLLTVFISIITITYELNQSKINKNREKRIEFYKKSLDKILEVSKKHRESKSVFFEIYSRRNIEEHIAFIENIGGINFLLYKEKNKNWKEKLIRETINKRWELLKEFLKIKEEIVINLEFVLNNKLLFNPIDEIEKEELKYSEVKEYIDLLEDYLNNINNIVRSFNSNTYEIKKMFLKYPTKNQKELEKYIDDMEELLFKQMKFLDALDLIQLYLSFATLYLKLDLIYVDDNWKKEFLKDYNEKFYNLVNRNEIVKNILMEATKDQDDEIKNQKDKAI